jgi:hypothetical protein
VRRKGKKRVTQANGAGFLAQVLGSSPLRLPLFAWAKKHQKMGLWALHRMMGTRIFQ